MSLTRILVTTKETVSHTFFVGETKTSVDSGNVTATLKRLDGTTVNTAAATPVSVGLYSYAVPAQATLDTLRLEWSGLFNGVTAVVADYIEIVGGFLFELAEARAAHRFLADTNRFPTAMLAAKRIEVEQEIEDITGQAWVPRFSRRALNGRGYEQLATPDAVLRTLRTATIGGVALSSTDLAVVASTDSGVFVRPTGALWPAGFRNVVAEYEHGNDAPPEPIREAGILRLRSRLAMTTTEIPDRAISWSAAEGGTYRLSTPGRLLTGVPEVDGILSRPGYTRRRPRVAVA